MTSEISTQIINNFKTIKQLFNNKMNKFNVRIKTSYKHEEVVDDNNCQQ